MPIIQASTGPAASTKLYVKLKRTDDTTKNTGLIQLKTSLTIEMCSHHIEQNTGAGIYKYECNRTFFRGRGSFRQATVTAWQNQKLGVMAPSTTFIPTAAGWTAIPAEATLAFPADICQRNNFLKIPIARAIRPICVGSTWKSADPACVGITMGRALRKARTSRPLTALPRSRQRRKLPLGLVKVRPYVLSHLRSFRSLATPDREQQQPTFHL